MLSSTSASSLCSVAQPAALQESQPHTSRQQQCRCGVCMQTAAHAWLLLLLQSLAQSRLVHTTDILESAVGSQSLQQLAYQMTSATSAADLHRSVTATAVATPCAAVLLHPGLAQQLHHHLGPAVAAKHLTLGTPSAWLLLCCRPLLQLAPPHAWPAACPDCRTSCCAAAGWLPVLLL
jgi:hypothetical protein